jgi:hypothetical protein
VKTLNEQSGYEFTSRFTANDDSPISPTTAHWRVDCLTNAESVKDWTEAQVVTEVDEFGNVLSYHVDVEVDGQYLSILDRKNAYEIKQILVVADKGTSREFSEDPPHQVKIRRVQGRG